MVCNPVSIVRYFEFAFGLESANWNLMSKCLDVSSPRLFYLYLLHTYDHITFDVLNPDLQDLQETAEYLKVLKLTDRVTLTNCDIMSISTERNDYDLISSISVLEHIPDSQDKLALGKLWELLRPGGRLIITVPCANVYSEEWRETDVYGQGNPEKEGKFFFQRFYDMPAIKERIIDELDVEPIIIKVFGEKKEGAYAEYEKRWIAAGLWETIKDPYYIARDYQLYSQITDLKGIGICGLVFEKGAH